MEEGIVPGGTGSLLYSLIFPNHESAKVNSDEPVNTASLDELRERMQAARTVAQIKNESKTKQLARLEAASSKKRKSGDPDEPSSEVCGGAGGDALSKKQVPFARYRACTQSTRKELEQKKHAAECDPVKKKDSEAVGSGLRGKLEAPSPQVDWRGEKVEQQGQSEFLVDSQKVNSKVGVGSKGQVWGYREQAETLEGSQGSTRMSKHVLKTKTSVPNELPSNLWPLSKTEEEFVYTLNVDSPMRARYFVCWIDDEQYVV